MYITRTLPSKKRSAITTTLGTLIFISIMFTALIPLQLSMLQTDIVETQICQDIKLNDNEKELETLNLVAYPTTTTSDQLKVRVQNTGTLNIKLVKIMDKRPVFRVK